MSAAANAIGSYLGRQDAGRWAAVYASRLQGDFFGSFHSADGDAPSLAKLEEEDVHVV
jgi:hypothetical protein